MKPTAISKAPFGKADAEITLYTLTNANGLTMKVTNYGGIITELWVPDKAGKKVDVVLGYDKLDDYVKNNPVLRRDHRPRRQSHQGCEVQARGQGLQARGEQRQALAARRQEGLGQGRVDGRDERDR